MSPQLSPHLHRIVSTWQIFLSPYIPFVIFVANVIIIILNISTLIIITTIWSWSWNWNPAAASLWASKCQPALRVCNIAIIFIFNLHHHQSVYDYQSVESFSKCAKLLTLITTNHSLQTHQKNCDCLAIITLESTKWECSEIWRQPYWGPMYKSKFPQFLPDANTNARFKPEQPEPKRDLKKGTWSGWKPTFPETPHIYKYIYRVFFSSLVPPPKSSKYKKVNLG